MKRNKTKIMLLALCLMLSFSLAGCGDSSQNNDNSSIENSENTEMNKENEGKDNMRRYNISQEEGKKMLDEDDSIFLIDVRSENEYEAGHIPDSILIPLGNIEEDIEDYVPDLDSKIFLYCRSGNRSGQATVILRNMGYTDVWNLGGINSWPYEIVE